MGKLLLMVAAFSIAASTVLGAADPDALYRSAVEASEAGEHARAKSQLEELLAQGKLAPEVFLLLGNSEYRLGDLGRAALAYRRALVLQPAHPEARQNLRFLTERAGLLSFIDQADPGLARRSPPRLLAGAIAGGILLCAVAIAILLAARRRPPWLRVAGVVAIAVGGCGAATAGVLAIQQEWRALDPASSVVTGEAMVARSAPADASSEIIPLPAGSVVIELKSRGPWTYVDIPGDLRGWVRAGGLETLWPFAP